MTQEGFSKLQDELRQLRTVERPAIVQAIAEARALGDLSENAEYHCAREKQSFIERRIAELEEKVSCAEIIDTSRLSGEAVKFGATVRLMHVEVEEEIQYRIVGADEADLDQGLISISSPLARVLIGKSVGDSVDVHSPSGSKTYEILAIAYGNAR
jgi:transcription elongation factor GreA